MSLFSRLIGKKKPIIEPVVPDDTHLATELRMARRANAVATGRLQQATEKITNDANMAREVIQQVLNRADRVRAIRHANIQE